MGFFLPVDRRNEHYATMLKYPGWSFHGSRYTKWDLLEQRRRMMADHPRTTFICPHAANNPEDLDWVSALMEDLPNVCIDFSARMDELGRQPYTARDFLIRWQDRVIFGTDMPISTEMYRCHFRFLETSDEYFDYPGYLGESGQCHAMEDLRPAPARRGAGEDLQQERPQDHTGAERVVDMSTIDRRELYAWCRIPCEKLERHKKRRVPFRLVKDSAAMGELMAAELVEAIQQANERGEELRAIIPCGPSSWYEPFTTMVNAHMVTLERFVVYHMDECLDWQGRELPRAHPYSFRGFMERHFYDPVAPALAVPERNRFWLSPATMERCASRSSPGRRT